MIVIRVLQIVIALMSLFFLFMAVYDRFLGRSPGPEEKSGFGLYLSLFGAGVVMSLLLWRLAKTAAKHL